MLVVTHPSWLPLLGRFLVVDARPQYADAVVPLVGEPQRAVYAAELVREGWARLFVITPLPLPDERDAYLREVLSIARSRGVAGASTLHVPTSAPSTYHEAANLRRFVEGAGVDSLLVVTSPWHTRRSKIVFAHAFRGSPIRIQVVPVPDYAYDLPGRVYRPDAWWRSAAGRGVTASEYLKLAAFALGVR